MINRTEFIFLTLHGFHDIFIFSRFRFSIMLKIHENQYKMNISQGKTLDLELKILEILENTLSLRQRSSMMPASLRTLRHATIMYSASCVRFRGLYVPEIAGRGSKSREKVYSIWVFAEPAMRTGLPCISEWT